VDPGYFGTDADLRIRRIRLWLRILLSSLEAEKMPTKIILFAYNSLRVHLHKSSKIKKVKKK
jgi:hypothetical protein